MDSTATGIALRQEPKAPTSLCCRRRLGAFAVGRVDGLKFCASSGVDSTSSGRSFRLDDPHRSLICFDFCFPPLLLPNPFISVSAATVGEWSARHRRSVPIILCAKAIRPGVPNPVHWYRTLNSPVRNFEQNRAEFQEILAKPIRELGLKLEGSPIERFVQQLYRELEAKGHS